MNTRATLSAPQESKYWQVNVIQLVKESYEKLPGSQPDSSLQLPFAKHSIVPFERPFGSS